MSVILCTGESDPRRTRMHCTSLHPHISSLPLPPLPHLTTGALTPAHIVVARQGKMSEGTGNSDVADEECVLLCTAGYDHTIR